MEVGIYINRNIFLQTGDTRKNDIEPLTFQIVLLSEGRCSYILYTTCYNYSVFYNIVGTHICLNSYRYSANLSSYIQLSLMIM